MKPLGSSAVASMPAVGGKNCAGSGSTDKNKASASRGIPTRWCGGRLWPQRLTPRIVVRKVHTIGIASNRIPTAIARTTPQESRRFLPCKLGGAGLAHRERSRTPAAQKNEIRHVEPQPREQRWDAALHGNLQKRGVEVAQHVVLNKSPDVPLTVVHPYGLHSHAEPGMLAHQTNAVFPHKHPKMCADVIAL